MDKKLCVELIEKRGNNVYSFHVPYGAPDGELYDVVRAFLLHIDEYLQKKAQEASSKADAPASDAQKQE